MREEIARVVSPVFAAGLELKDRLHRGERPDLDTEQKELKRLLQGEGDVRGGQEFHGDRADSSSLNVQGSNIGQAVLRREDEKSASYLGLRYPLVCWLDEILIRDSPWSDEWVRRMLEIEYYVAPERAWRFWQQQERVERGDRATFGDALEVYYLCVVLGFRGNYDEQLGQRPQFRERVDRLGAWMRMMHAQVSQSYGKDECPYLPPAQPDPVVNVPPRHGQRRFQRMVLLGGSISVLLLVCVGLALFFVRN
jgi:type VI secretion system protein ImpK